MSKRTIQSGRDEPNFLHPMVPISQMPRVRTGSWAPLNSQGRREIYEKEMLGFWKDWERIWKRKIPVVPLGLGNQPVVFIIMQFSVCTKKPCILPIYKTALEFIKTKICLKHYVVQLTRNNWSLCQSYGKKGEWRSKERGNLEVRKRSFFFNQICWIKSPVLKSKQCTNKLEWSGIASLQGQHHKKDKWICHC